MVEYKLQLIIFFTRISLFLHITTMPVVWDAQILPFVAKKYRCGILGLGRPSRSAPLLKTKTIDHSVRLFTFSDSLPTVNSNTIFGKITSMAFEKYPHGIQETLVLPLFWPGLVRNNTNNQHLMPETEKLFSFQYQ